VDVDLEAEGVLEGARGAARTARVREVGDVTAIAASRPHMFGVQTEWSNALGGGARHAAEGAFWGQST
jgi:hypothetical protein